MSEEKFTKGPWHWSRYDFVDGFYGLYAGDTPVVYPQRRNDGDEGNAWFSMDESYYGETALKPEDAALIAAAPDMYEEIKRDIQWLKRVRDMFVIGSDMFRSCSLRIESKEKLLAKARGEDDN